MKFTINNRKIKADDSYLIGYNLDYIAYFEFDAEWAGTVKTARFYQEDKYTDVALVDDSCTIPPLVKGRLKVGVFNSDITTTYASLWVNASIKDESGNPVEPAEDIYTQLIKLIEAHMFKGEDGVGIESIVQTVISTESDGDNVFTVTLTDGRAEDFVIKNGSAGKDGKSAYQYALEHGYSGTEEEWGQLQVDSEKNAELILNKVNAAEYAKLEAQASAQSADQSAVSAYNSKVLAEAAADRAEAADASARKASANANTMASSATTSEANAKQSEENAAASMQSAETSATAAQSSASAAAVSEKNAKSSSDSALNFAKQAEISMNTCELASSLANGAKIAAEKARDEILAIDIPTKVSQLENDNEYITKTVDNLVNYYTKSNTYSKEEILEITSNINTLQTVIVDVLPDTGETNYIYLVPNSRSDTNIYDEYIFIQNKWEQIGSTDIDLTQYVNNEVFSSHTDDAIVHITSDERAKWNEKDVFVAIYGTTTSAEIEEAYQAGKTILCQNEKKIAHMAVRISDNAVNFVFTSPTSAANQVYTCMNSTWLTTTLPYLPSVAASDEGKILKVDSSGKWVTESQVIDAELDLESTNPVENQAITNWLAENVKDYSLAKTNDSYVYLSSSGISTFANEPTDTDGTIEKVKGIIVNNSHYSFGVDWLNVTGKPETFHPTAHSHDYIPTSQKGANSGVAELDNTGKVPSSQLPSYVDDVIEGYYYDSKFYKEAEHSTEIAGETGKIYVDLDTNKTYRWSGSAFVIISDTIALGETSSTAYRGDRGKIAYDHSQSTHARTDATNTAKSDTNGNIKINGSETTVYTHPSSHPATMITEDSTHRFMTDAERNTISNLGNKYVSYTKNSGVDVRGTTQDTYSFNPGQIVVKDGVVIGGTALSAGLVTRGICGVTSPDTATGSCAKENLYINYDGDNTYKVDRQLILQAGTIGTHYGNNLYEFAVPRGEIVKNYCDANYGKKSDLTSHTGNSTIHITAAERIKWNDAVVTASSVSAFVGGTSVASQISAATENLAQVQIVTWEATD